MGELVREMTALLKGKFLTCYTDMVTFSAFMAITHMLHLMKQRTSGAIQ